MAQQEQENGNRGLSIRWKIIGLFTFLFLAVFIGTVTWFYFYTSRLMVDEIKEELATIAVEAAAAIDAEQHLRLEQSGEADDADYEAIAETLRLWGDFNPDVDAIYTAIETPNTAENGELAFLVSADPDPESRAGFFEVYAEAADLPAMLGAFDIASGEYTTDDDINPDEFGTWLSGYAPIVTDDGEVVGIVGVDILAEEVLFVRRNLAIAAAVALGVIVVILAGSVVYISSQVTQPLISVSDAAEVLEEGKEFDPAMLSDVGRRSDELGQLARVFSDMAVQVQARERQLRQQVQELQIIIDEQRKEEQVAEIVESEFFQDLKSQAANLRRRRRDDEPAEEDTAASPEEGSD